MMSISSGPPRLFLCAAGAFAILLGILGGWRAWTGAHFAPDPATTRIGGILRQNFVPEGVLTPTGLTVPKGFAVDVLAAGLVQPRRIAIAPGGTPDSYDLFVSESRANRVTVLPVRNGRNAGRHVFASGTVQPYGLAFAPGFLYVGTTGSVVRFPYRAGDLQTDGAAKLVAPLTAGGYNQHWTRNLLFSPDGRWLFVTVGSSCNTCIESDPQRAAITRMAPDGTHRTLYATGTRNPVGLAWRPGTGELWTVVNERDHLGDELPADYMTRVTPGGFYGWPYAYPNLDGTDSPDPTFGDLRPDKVEATLRPTLPVQAHSAALGITFYPLNPVKSATPLAQPFPPDCAGDAFLAFHGSWNRSRKTGYKIVRVHFRNGKPVSISDFVNGFLRPDQSQWGRPVDVTIAPDGSLLFSDDGGGKIWRVRYVGSRS